MIVYGISQIFLSIIFVGKCVPFNGYTVLLLKMVTLFGKMRWLFEYILSL